VDNEGGSIYGNTGGVKISGPGAVTNTGSITGQTADGVRISGGGIVNSLATNGIIWGAEYGVEISGGTGFVYNAGSIIGTNHDGVRLRDSGTVDNEGGSIFGNTGGVKISGPGAVTNTGSIIGQTADGVRIGTNGIVNNLTTNGTIWGAEYGVEIAGTGSVYNAGSIVGTNHDGVRLRDTGTVDNEGGFIYGNTGGVKISGPGAVTNTGSIIGQTADGVRIGTNGIVNNLTTNGTIWGAEYGVEIAGTGSVYNAGSIVGTNHDGVRLRDTGTVDNEGGFIYGNTGGVKISGPGAVTNTGSITGQTADGVRISGGGIVNSLATNGIIWGAEYGVLIGGSTGFVYNAGSIIGTNHDGVRLWDGGVVDNEGGFIYGNTSGVKITGGPAYVTNAGTIIGGNGRAISLGNDSNTVVLKTGSDVQGDIVGGTGIDAAFLQGHGSYNSNFVNFETLTVQGDGTSTGWNLTGTNGFSQSATVSNGLLSINGGLTSSVVNVDITGSLGGTGTVFSIVSSHGVIAPGNSIGTLNFVGSLNMTNSVYDEEVNAAGQSDLINVSGSPGTAIISNATVVVLLAHELYGSNTVYTNLTATGGVLGTNAGVSISNAPLFLTVALDYPDTNTVETILHRSKFTSVANTFNQHSVAGALDGIADPARLGNAPAMSNLVNEFFWLPDAGTAQKALDSMSGEIHGSLGMLDVQQQAVFNNSIALRTGRISAGGESSGSAAAKPVQLASAGSALPPMQQQSEADQLLDNIWLQGFGTFGHLKDDGNASGGNFTVSGTSGGFDYRLRPEMLVGLALGYSHDDAGVGGPGASGTVDAIQCAAYGGYVNGPWHLDGIFSYGFLQTDTKRFIKVGSISQEADGKYDGDVLSFSTEGGYVLGTGPVTIEPTLGLNYTYLAQNSFKETSAAPGNNNYDLNVHSVDMNSLRTALGVRLAAQFGEKDGVQFIPALRAAWEHEFLDKTADVNASFVGGSGNFIVRGVELGADSGVLGGGLTVAFNKAIQGFVNYDVHLNSRLRSQAVSGGLSYSW
jgi:outer membrane autotransporter protein